MTRIKNETGVSIKIPSDQDTSNIIRIEGSPEGVAKAKQELLEMVHKMVCYSKIKEFLSITPLITSEHRMLSLAHKVINFAAAAFWI